MKLRALLLAGLLLGNSMFADAPVRSGRVLGSPVSAITIDLYHDFQCPGCKVLYEQTIRPLIANYVEKGRVYLVEHYYPLPIHAHAKEAACYACAADRIGKYEQVCEILFKKQDEWSRTGKVDETVCSVLTPAESAKIRALVKDPTVMAEVQRDLTLGQQHGVNGTPTMLITKNGKTYTISTPVSYSMLTRVIDNLR